MDERLATVSEVEGRVPGQLPQGGSLNIRLAICHKANSSFLKRTVRKARKG